MQNANQTKTLKIDGMSGDLCVQKVTDALKTVPAVTTQSVKVGCATIQADQAGCDAACNAVTKAGYKASVDTKAGNDTASTNSKTPTQYKGAIDSPPLPNSNIDAAGTGKPTASETTKTLTNPTVAPTPGNH